MDSASRPTESAAVGRYYCHNCDSVMGSVADDFTCPTCHSGFIEKVEQQLYLEEPDDDGDMEFDTRMMIHRIYEENLVGGRRRSNLPRRMVTTRVLTLQPERAPRRTSGTTIENLVEDIIEHYGDYSQYGGSPASRFFPRNPRDYFLGRDRFDAITSQLLNLTNGDGPPPLTKEKIREIPTALISQDHLDMKLGCSVCWEDFTINEKVLKLTCDHMYHKDCIIPWLKLHCTCPICRKYLADDRLSSRNSDPRPRPRGFSYEFGSNLEERIRARRQLISVMDPAWAMSDYEMASTSSDWPGQLGNSLPLPIVSSSSATQSPPTPSITTYLSATARNLRDQGMSTSPADVEPMETEHHQNLPAGNNTNNS